MRRDELTSHDLMWAIVWALRAKNIFPDVMEMDTIKDTLAVALEESDDGVLDVEEM